MDSRKVIELTGTLLGWTTLGIQFYLMQNNSETDLLETTIRFFSYFTIVSNLMVVLCFTSLYFNILSLFSSFKTLTAVVVYISIVALVYNTVLRYLWKPKGIQQVVDELLHVIIPIVFLYYWFKNKNTEKLHYKFTLHILIIPLVYLIYVLIRGNYSNFYPYPFIDVSAIGLTQALTNAVLVMIAFITVALLFIRSSRS